MRTLRCEVDSEQTPAVRKKVTIAAARDRSYASRRAAARSQVLTYEDIAALAHHFGVSSQAALFRPKSLSIVNEAEFTELRDKEQYGRQYLELLQVLVDLEGHDEIAVLPICQQIMSLMT